MNTRIIAMSVLASLAITSLAGCSAEQPPARVSEHVQTAGAIQSAPKVYPSTADDIIGSEAKKLTEDLFKAETIEEKYGKYYYFDGTAGESLTVAKNEKELPSFMVDTSFGKVCVLNPYIDASGVDPDINALFTPPNQGDSGTFYCLYGGYDAELGVPWFELGGALFVGFSIYNTAIEKRDVKTLVDQYTPEVFPEFALDIYAEDTEEAPETVYTTPAEENGLGGTVYTLTGVVTDNRSEEIDGRVVRNAIVKTQYGEAMIVDLTGDTIGAPLRAMYKPPKTNKFVKVYAEYVGFSNVYDTACFYIDGEIVRQEITKRWDEINRKNLKSLYIWDYEAIKTGMTLEEVEDTLRCKGSRTSSVTNELGEAEMYEWKKDTGTVISVIFVDGKVSKNRNTDFK